MAKVIALMSMSLDGYVADTGDGVAEVFDWHTAGDVDVPTASSDFTFHVSAASAEHLRAVMGEVGAMLTGRRTFNKADGWDGQHPWGIPAFVVTHHVPEGWPRPGSTVHFVTEGVESAVAQAVSAAGDRAVGVHGGETDLPVPRRRPARRDAHRSRSGVAGRWCPLVRPAPGRTDNPRQSDGGRRRRRHPSALPGARALGASRDERAARTGWHVRAAHAWRMGAGSAVGGWGRPIDCLLMPLSSASWYTSYNR